MAAENRLWGAPRIHGELLKVGITVSERTVSRYLRDRPRAPSQTWRTFFANHLGQLALISPAPYATCADDVIDISGLTFRQRPLSGDELYPSYQCAVVDWPASVQRRSLGTHIVQDHVRGCVAIHNSGGRDPPHRRLRPTHDGCVDNRLLLLHRTSATNDSVRPWRTRRANSSPSSGGETFSFGLLWERYVMICTGVAILATHTSSADQVQTCRTSPQPSRA